MNAHQFAIETRAQQYIALCHRGFANEHAHKDWMGAHILEMQSWPETLRFAVVAAWMNSGPKELASETSAEGPQE